MDTGLLINIGVGVLIAIAAVIGVVVGFSRQFSKPLVVLVSLVVAIIVVMLCYPLIFNTGILDGFVTKATGWFKKDFYSRPITDLDSLQAAISDNYLRVLSGQGDKLLTRMQSVLHGVDEMTLGAFFGRVIVNVIIEFSMWLVCYLIVKYFLYGVKYLLCRITEVVVFKSIDRILGIVWSLLLTYIIAVGILLTASEIIVVQFFPNAEPSLAQQIEKASIIRLAHDTNVLGSFVANLLNMPLVTLG